MVTLAIPKSDDIILNMVIPFFIILALFLFVNSLPMVYGQTIQVNTTDLTPCFLNDTAGAQMWENCGMGEDFLQTIFLGWEWATGGYFTMTLVGIFSLMTYIKYHKAVYPLMIVIMFLPVSHFLFPIELWMFVALWTIALIGALLYFVFVKQTKEF